MLPLLTAAPLAIAQAVPNAAHKADPRIATLLSDLGKTQSPMQAAISPDGTTVAWSARSKDGVVIHLSSVNNPDPAKDKVIGTGLAGGDAKCGNALPTWSPDGESLAFVSTCTGKAAGQAQIFAWSKATGQTKQITHVTGSIEAPAWSPDGKAIAFLFVENATRTAGALDAMKPPSGVIGEDGVEIQRIAAVDVTNEAFTQMTPADLHVYEFDWAPDSQALAFVAAKPPGENTWWIAQLYIGGVFRDGQGHLINGATFKDQLGMVPKSILNTTTVTGPLHGLQIAVPRYSPDGKQIAFIGGLMSDQGSTGGDVYRHPLSPVASPGIVTPNRAASPAYIHWVDDFEDRHL